MKVFFGTALIIIVFCQMFVFAQKDGEISISLSGENEKTGFVKDLKPENLKIKFGNSSPTITSLQPDDGPASIGILFDVSGSVQNWKSSNGFKASLFLTGLEQFVRSSNTENEYFVVAFNQKTTRLVDKTQSHEVVFKGLELLRDVEPEGNTSFYDALEFGLENLSAAKYTKRILLIVSDGADNTSMSSFDDLRRMLRTLNIMLYSVWIDETTRVSSVSDMQGMAFLDELTLMTGGRSLYIRKPIEINDAFEKISSELRNQYRLTFVPKEPKKSRWNKLKIEVQVSSKSSESKEGKIKLRHRAGLIY